MTRASRRCARRSWTISSPRRATGGADRPEGPPAGGRSRFWRSRDECPPSRIQQGQQVLRRPERAPDGGRGLRPQGRRGRVRVAHRPLRLRQVDRDVDGGRSPDRHPRRGHRGGQGDHRPGPGPRRRVPGTQPVPLDDGAGQRPHRRRPGPSPEEPRRARGDRASPPRAGRPRGLGAQEAGRALGRHAPARRPGARLRAHPARAPARRAVRHARLDHARRAAGGAARALGAGPQDRAHDHPRRRRGAVPVRSGGDDDARSRGQGRRHPDGAVRPSARPPRCPRRPALLRAARTHHGVPRIGHGASGPGRAGRAGAGTRAARAADRGRGRRGGGVNMSSTRLPRLVVVGNGMVGHRFVEAAAERGLCDRRRLLVIAEEPRLAYDRVNLSKWFQGKSADELSLVEPGEYERLGVDALTGDPAIGLDCPARTVRTGSGREFEYDALVLATGSSPFVPPIEGRQLAGCFVYRTLDDLVAIRDAARTAKSGAVIGGGLLGLEAASALLSLGLRTHVVEMAPRLMPLQVDDVGGVVLRQRIEELGVAVMTGVSTREVLGDACGRVRALRFEGGEELPVDLVVFSAGIRPRDELARAAGLRVGERGGVVIDESCRTSDPHVLAIGECAVFEGRTYGLAAPGYRMAEVAAARLAGETLTFAGFDMSTKLKLLGVDVGSFGDAFGKTPGARTMSLFDGVAGIYKRLVVSADGKLLLGGILIGDASSYGELTAYVKSSIALPERPDDLLVPPREGGGARRGVQALPDAALICSCRNVTKGQICSAIRERRLARVGDVKTCTTAGTGCGSCATLLDDLLEGELARAGIAVVKHLCEHFPHTRQELYHLVRLRGIRSFDELIARHGRGEGCEICKP